MTMGEGFANKYADPDPFQEMWSDPERLKSALYVHHGGRFMVRTDDRPVVPHHVMVVAREFQPVERLAFAEQQALWALVTVVYAHMDRVLKPNRKNGVVMWGNQVRTGHMHVAPRNEASDVAQWKPMDLSGEALAAQLAETCKLLTFSPELAAQTDALIDATLEHVAKVPVPEGLLLPPLPLPSQSGFPGQ